MDQNGLIQLIEHSAQKIIRFTGQLIATPSITPPGDERAIATLLLQTLKGLGLDETFIVGEQEERPNILCRLRGVRGEPTLLYVAHTDTKPVGDCQSQWMSDPFRPVLKDGKLYGLGAADMKAAVAAFVFAAAALRQLGPLQGDLMLAFVADEEGGGKYGAHYLTADYGLKADMALIGEPPGITREWEYIHLGSRGLFCFNVRVSGTQMHSSLSDYLPSVNASLKLADLMVRMSRDLKLHFDPHPLSPNGVTVNLGVRLQGGVYFGVYPGWAEFGVDVRTLPGMKKDTLIRDIQEFLRQRQVADPSLKVEFETEPPPLDWIDPVEVSDDLPLVNALASASKAVLGFCPPSGLYPAATDAPKFQLQAGIPTIPAFGAGMISLAHGPNEWVGTRSIVQAAEIYALAAYEILK